jgi:cystathionine beta-lyase
MWERELGPIRLVVEHRALGGDGGPALRIYSSAPEGRELLRFDCFEKGPHFHIDPAGRDVINELEPRDDVITVVMEDLGRDLEGYLKGAGLELARPLDRAVVLPALNEVEAEMRNPPLDLDALDLETLRRRRGEKWTIYPPDVLPAWVADMDFPVPEPVRRTLLRAVERSDLGYPVDLWMTGLRELTAERMETRFGWSINHRRVDIITDVVQGIYAGLEVFSEPDEGVVIQTPIYPPFLGAVRETRRRLIANPLVEGRDRYELDLDGLRRIATPSSRILLLCNPHNPSGRVFTRPELEALAEIALANDWIVLSDEIHEDLVFPGHRHIPFATLAPEVAARTVTFTSATKAFSIAGLRCAVATFGSEELQKRFRSIPRHLRGGIGYLGIEATRAAWRHGQPWLERVMAYLHRNRDHLTAFVRKQWPAVRHFPPEATYLAWLDFRALDLEGGPYRFFLDRARVGLSHGNLFGSEGEGFVRINFATSRPILDEILSRMNEALEGAGHRQ